MRRNYANAAPQLTLNTGISAVDTSLIVSGTFAGWPSATPYFAVLEYGTANMEIVLVTAVAGTSATIVRGQSNTIAVSHLAGATLDHGFVAQDADEANAHSSGSTGVHGLAAGSAVVGTNDTQTLSNKTLSSPKFTGTVNGDVSFGGAVTTAGLASVLGVQVHGFANATERGGAIPSPVVGTIVYMADTGQFYVYQGSPAGWVPLIVGDTGELTNTSIFGGFTNAAGWSTTIKYRIRAGIMFVEFDATRTGSALTASSSSPQSVVTGMTSKLPTRDLSVPDTKGGVWAFSAGGTLTLMSYPSIATGAGVGCAFIYPI